MLHDLNNKQTANAVHIHVFCEPEDAENVNVVVDKCLQPLLSLFTFEVKTILVPSEYSDVQQFLLMSMCDSIVIANSTYSWWAAYIACLQRSDVQVCCPNRWFHTSTPEGYIVPGWNLIGW